MAAFRSHAASFLATVAKRLPSANARRVPSSVTGRSLAVPDTCVAPYGVPHARAHGLHALDSAGYGLRDRANGPGRTIVKHENLGHFPSWGRREAGATIPSASRRESRAARQTHPNRRIRALRLPALDGRPLP